MVDNMYNCVTVVYYVFIDFSSFLCLSHLSVYLWYGLVPEIKRLIDWLIHETGFMTRSIILEMRDRFEIGR